MNKLVNNHSRYSIQGIADDEKKNALRRLMYELNEGRRSGEEEGWVSEEDVRTHFRTEVR